MEKDYRNKILKKQSLRHLMFVSFDRHLNRWPLWSGLISVLFVFITVKNRDIISFSLEHSFDSFVLAVSSVAIILGALGLVLTIYDKKLLLQVLETDNARKEDTFAGFVSPYVYGAFLWVVVGLLALYLSISQMHNCALAIIYLFFLIYSLLFIMYIIGEIIQHTII